MHEQVGQAQDPTNEELFWDAFGVHTSMELFNIGGTIDGRVGFLIDELHAQFLTEGASPLEKGRELAALQIARGRVDQAYGRMTGYARNGGCSMGGPVTYHDSSASW